jgi:hypothetical protein
MLRVIYMDRIYVSIRAMVKGPKLGSMRPLPVGLGLVPPIDRRLDQLLFLAHQAGHPTTRHQLVGALIRDSPTEPGQIISMLDRYRGTDADDVLIPGVPAPDATVKRPGRRKL